MWTLTSPIGFNHDTFWSSSLDRALARLDYPISKFVTTILFFSWITYRDWMNQPVVLSDLSQTASECECERVYIGILLHSTFNSIHSLISTLLNKL